MLQECFKDAKDIDIFEMLNKLSTDYGRPEKKLPSQHGRKFNPNPKFLGTATSAQFFRYLRFILSLGVRSP